MTSRTEPIDDLQLLKDRWREEMEQAGPQHMKTMAEALSIIRGMEASDNLSGKQDDPFRNFKKPISDNPQA